MENNKIELRSMNGLFDAIIPIVMIVLIVFILTENLFYCLFALAICIVVFQRELTNGIELKDNQIIIYKGLIQRKKMIFTYEMLCKVTINQILATSTLQKCVRFNFKDNFE